jgi:signal transduction histidine kinase
LKSYLHVLYFYFISGVTAAQHPGYFARLMDIYAHSQNSGTVDSITSIPYDVMVSDFDLSSVWMSRGLAISNRINYANGVANSSSKLATISYLRGQYDSSVYYNLKAIALYDSLHEEVQMGVMLCELGYQMKRRDLSRSFGYFRQGLALLEKNNANDKLSAGYDNFGVLFEMNEQLDSADYFYTKALQIKTNLFDSIGIPFSLNNLGLLQIMKGNFDSAKNYFEQAYRIRSIRNDEFGIAENKSYFGDLYKAWQNWNEAIKWYELSNADCVALKYPRQIQYNFEQLAFCLEKSGRPAEAISALQQSIRINDELLNEENSRTMLELEQKYKSAEKDKNIAVLEAKTASRNLWIYGIASILLFVVIGALWYNTNQKRIAKSIKDAAIIAEREAGLKALFEATESERKRIARDLHDGIGQQLSGLRLSWESLGSKLSNTAVADADQLSKLNTVLDEACRELRTISHTMMPRALQENGLVIAMDELLLKTIGFTQIKYTFEHFSVGDLRWDESVELSIYRVFQELLNNVLKHSAASFIAVQFYKNGKHLILIVEDNGIGMNESFDSGGIGKMNIITRLSTINGEATWTPGPERGTVATVRVPVQ